MRRLREQGIYKLPGSERPVRAVASDAGAYLLYDEEFGTSLPPRFEMRADGRIRNWHGDPTTWTVEDLTDTGKTHEA